MRAEVQQPSSHGSRTLDHRMTIATSGALGAVTARTRNPFATPCEICTAHVARRLAEDHVVGDPDPTACNVIPRNRRS
jgi:hypothetical protein